MGRATRRHGAGRPLTHVERPRSPLVVCLEGPSAVGKTTLAAALARERGARVVAELDARGAPAVPASAEWFVERHAELWQLARSQPLESPFTVIDGDPLKGLWYNWIYAADGWPGLDVVAPLYRAHVRRGTIAFPDLYVVLEATEQQLRRRRAGDATRRRRAFETHIRMIEPQRRYFAALQAAAPLRVAFVDSSRRDALVGRVHEALRQLPADAPDPVELLERMLGWLETHSPGGELPEGKLTVGGA